MGPRSGCSGVVCAGCKKGLKRRQKRGERKEEKGEERDGN